MVSYTMGMWKSSSYGGGSLARVVLRISLRDWPTTSEVTSALARRQFARRWVALSTDFCSAILG